MNSQTNFILALAIAMLATYSEAFVTTPASSRAETVALNAWSIPTTTDMSMFASSFTSMQQDFDPTRSWYTEPATRRRKTVYKDISPEYTLISAGRDWPSMDAETNAQTQIQMRAGPLKPLRVAARWARRRL